MYKAGLRTSQAIAEASVPEIVKALFESSAWAAEGKSVFVDSLIDVFVASVRSLQLI